jgi:hypothetical protein
LKSCVTLAPEAESEIPGVEKPLREAAPAAGAAGAAYGGGSITVFASWLTDPA